MSTCGVYIILVSVYWGIFVDFVDTFLYILLYFACPGVV